MQFACFICRKSFKRLQASGATNRLMTNEQQNGQWKEAEQTNSRSYKCPDCGGQTYSMGLDFKAPKRSDVKGWRKVETSIISGHKYYRGASKADGSSGS